MKQRSELFDQFYQELRRLARRRLAAEKGPNDATSLVHEAYLKLRTWGVQFQNDQHFLATASNAIRQVLVDRARARATRRRGGGLDPISISLGDPARCSPDFIDVLLLDELIKRLAVFDARAAQIVEMRIFLGLTDAEIAASMGLSSKTVKRDWSVSKAWFRAELSPPTRLSHSR
jgi:RNA polymerase sigma factor (TIGR02999 family)